MAGLNPGVRGTGGPAANAAKVSQTGAVPSGGTNNGFNFDLSGLKDLEKQLNTIISQFGRLDKMAQSFSGHLGSSTMGGVSGSTNLTVASVSGINSAGKLSTAAVTAGGAPANKNTAAPVSAFGGSSKAIGYAAGAEVLASAGGYVNQKMSQFQQGYTPVQLLAAQQAAVTGTTTQANVTAFTGIKNQGPQDLGQAMSAFQQNSFFNSINPRSKNFQNLKGFLNASQRLNPGEGASGALGFANALTSPQATQYFSMRGIASTGGGLVNAINGDSINSAATVYKTVLEAITGQKNITPQLAKQLASNPRTWTSAQQNAGLAGLSPQQTRQIQQFAASGMNLGSADQKISGTVASTLLSRTTAGTKTGADIMQSTTGLQNAENSLATNMQKFANEINSWLPGMSTGAGAAAQLGKTLATLGAQFFGLKALLKTIGVGKGVAGAAAGGAGAAETGAGADALATGGAAAGGIGLGGAAALALPVAGLGLSAYAFTHLKTSQRIVGGKKVPAYGTDLGDPTGSTTTSGMQPNLSQGINAMKAANPSIQINSGHRTQSQQANVYAMKGGQGAVRPGQSAHQLGKAADIGPPSQYAWIAANAPSYGLATDRSEPWHVQAIGDSGAGNTVSGAQVVSTASSQIGTPYVWGGETPGKAFDCSGLVQYVFSQLGINLPRTSQAQATVGKAVNGLNNAQAGDIILYNEPGEGPNSHVAIYIGGNKQIAAPHTGTTVQVQGVDTSHISTIRRVVGGGAGGKVVAAAQGTVGQPSNDSANHSGGAAATSLTNTFISMVNAGGTGGGAGPALGGGSSGGSSAPSSTTVANTGAASVPTSGTLTALQVQQAWIQAGGPSNVARTMAGIAMAESSDQPGIVQKGQPYSTTGWGLWQITPGNSEPQIGVDQALLNPVTNAKAALAKYRDAGSTLRPWTGDHYLTQNHINPQSSGVGDPVGGFNPNLPPPTTGGSGPVSAMRGNTKGVTVTIGPIYVQGTQSDANNIAQMVASAVRSNQDLKAVAGS